MPAVSFDDYVRLLTNDAPPRVWSLLVTIFGDLAQDKHAEISGALLGQMMSAIGIKPEATRVALHRLKKEGWLETKRVGRSSRYFLTSWGHGQSVAASPRIYAAKELAEQAWLNVWPAPPGEKDGENSGIWVAPNIQIVGRTAGMNAFSVKIAKDQELPDWMRNKLCDEDLAQLCLQVTEQFTALTATLTEPKALTALERAILRVLVVHSWRRIALRLPALPDRMFPETWPGPECRRLAADLMTRLPAPRLAELETE